MEYEIYCEECEVNIIIESDLKEEPFYCPYCASDIEILEDEDED